MLEFALCVDRAESANALKAWLLASAAVCLISVVRFIWLARLGAEYNFPTFNAPTTMKLAMKRMFDRSRTKVKNYTKNYLFRIPRT